MSKHYGVFDCGCKGEIQLFGRASDRASQANYVFSQKCYECKRKEANDKSKQESEKLGFPNLVGTEKQVLWANTIRSEFYNEIQMEINICMEENRFSRLRTLINKKDINDEQIVPYVYNLLNHMLTTKLQASYYIDNREAYNLDMVRRLEKDFNIYEHNKVLGATDELILESTVEPMNRKYTGVVHITATDKVIEAIYEKNERFREIVKSLGYKWGGVWEKTIAWHTGNYEDRAAELGNTLLNAGFSVCILNEDIRRNAIDGVFEPECIKWVKYRNSKFEFCWFEDNDTLYKSVRKINGSRWDKPYVTVPLQNYQEVLDFADINGFKFTDTAEQALGEFKEKAAKIIKVEPVKANKEEPKNKLKEILTSGDDILDDLIDETA